MKNPLLSMAAVCMDPQITAGCRFQLQCCRNEPHELRNLIGERRDSPSPQVLQQGQHRRLLWWEVGTVGAVQTTPEMPARC